MMNRTRLGFIRSIFCRHVGKGADSTRTFEGLDFVDVGCRGEILSEGGGRQIENGGRTFWQLNHHVMDAAFQRFESHIFSRRINVCQPKNQKRLFNKHICYCMHSTSTKTMESEPQLSDNLIDIMEQKLSVIEKRHAYLQDISNQPDVSPEEYSTAKKELKKLRHTIDVLTELRKKQKEIEDLKLLMAETQDDKEMHQMASEEFGQASEEEKRLRYLLLKSLLPKDDADERDCILEVRAGSGGEEASLFAMDIFKMYEKYSLKKGWKFEVLDMAESDLKGYKEVSAAVSGADVYGKLKFESGIHRVQRVPVTEKAGRVHTSAVSVAILPQADQVDVRLRNEDLKIDTYRSGGSGGQHVNTTNSAVRVTHVPTGLTVAIQDERSQNQNKAKALKVLCARLYEMERTRVDASRSRLRAEQIGSGDRSERIRTYNFPQGRVTDHRVGITSHSIDGVMQGENLDTFVDALLLQQEMDAIASFSSTQ